MFSASKEVIEDALLEIYGTEDAYRIVSMSEMLDMMKHHDKHNGGGARGYSRNLARRGGNRHHEYYACIGLRKNEGNRHPQSAGRKAAFIMRQFVIEAATISAIGGAAGIGFGYLLSSVATLVITTALDAEITVAPSLWAVLMAFGISAGIGVLFGYLPAKKAARLNPIDALRYE